MELSITLETFKDLEFTPKAFAEEMYNLYAENRRRLLRRLQDAVDEMRRLREALAFKESELEEASREGSTTGAYEQKEEIDGIVSKLMSQNISHAGLRFLSAGKEMLESNRRLEHIELFKSLASRDKEAIALYMSEDAPEKWVVLAEFLRGLELAMKEEGRDALADPVEQHARALEALVVDKYRAALEGGDMPAGRYTAKVLCVLGKRSRAIDIFVETLETGDEESAPKIKTSRDQIELNEEAKRDRLERHYTKLVQSIDNGVSVAREIFMSENHGEGSFQDEYNKTEYVDALYKMTKRIFTQKVAPMLRDAGEIADPFLFLLTCDLLMRKTRFVVECVKMLVPGLEARIEKMNVMGPCLGECPAKEIEAQSAAVRALVAGIRKGRAESPYSLNGESIARASGPPIDFLFKAMCLANKSISRGRRMGYSLEAMDSLYSSQFAGYLAIMEEIARKELSGPRSQKPFEPVEMYTEMFLCVKRYYREALGDTRDSDQGRRRFKEFEARISETLSQMMSGEIERIARGLGETVPALEADEALRALDYNLRIVKEKIRGANKDRVAAEILDALHDSIYAFCKEEALTKKKAAKLLDFVKAVRKQVREHSYLGANDKFDVLQSISELFLIDEEHVDEFVSRSELGTLGSTDLQMFLEKRKAINAGNAQPGH